MNANRPRATQGESLFSIKGWWYGWRSCGFVIYRDPAKNPVIGIAYQRRQGLRLIRR